MSTILEEIAAERRRQIEIEGWSPSHDDNHDGGELRKAAMCYFAHATGRASYRDDNVPMGWPWEPEWWKPKNNRHDLIRAGALFLADKERIKRRQEEHDRDPRVVRSTCASAAMTHTQHIDHKLDLIVAEIERLDQQSSHAQ